jgi:hypothetical protein
VAHGVAAAAGGPTPSPADLRSMTAAPDAISEKIRLMEQQLASQRDEIAASRLEISGLQRAQDAIDTEKDVTADYVVNGTVAAATPDSFVTHIPLSKKERRQRTHGNQGSFPKHPNKLVLKEPTKNSKDIQKAQKLTLPQHAVEVQKFLERNDRATKMAGTCWSLVLDMTAEVSSGLTSDSDSWHRADGVLERLLVVQNWNQRLPSVWVLPCTCGSALRTGSTPPWTSKTYEWTPLNGERAALFRTTLINSSSLSTLPLFRPSLSRVCPSHSPPFLSCPSVSFSLVPPSLSLSRRVVR